MQPDVISAASLENWQTQLKQAIRSTQELLDLLAIDSSKVGLSSVAEKEFPVRVPHSFARRMKSGDPNDPLLLQVLASAVEEVKVAGYGPDPIGEQGESNPVPGVLHKYHGRALLIVSGACAIHCRYCFRRHFPYEENRNNQSTWTEALAYINNDSSIEEVILSGGDPLIVTDKYLDTLVSKIAAIPHVRRLRIHSRLPIVLPHRITNDMIAAITRRNLETIMVVHCNHANEIDSEVERALATMRDSNITLLNQTVLLAGVNDTVAAQVNLNRRLFHAGAMPYYLHLLDKVQGAAHFDIPVPEALALHAEVQAQLPGYMIPRVVREEAGASSKTLVQD